MNSSVYTIYLSTSNTEYGGKFQPPINPVNKTNNANVSWSINWNELFRDNNLNNKYKKCRVRYDLRTSNFDAEGYNLEWNDLNGYLTTNLQSNNSLSQTQIGTMLGLIYPQRTNFSTSLNWYYLSSTLNEKGIDIIIPQYTSNLTISFYSALTQKLILSDLLAGGYEIMLYFELYND